MAVTLLKMRETRSAWLVLVPYGAVLGALALVGMYMGADGYSAVHPAALAAASGVALVWLLVDWSKGPLDRTLRILGLMLGMAVLVLAIYAGLGTLVRETVVPMLFCGIAVFTLAVVHFSFARGRRPRLLRWMLLGLLFRFAVVSLLVSSAVFACVIAVLVAREALPPVTMMNLPDVLGTIGIGAACIGGAAYLGFLPFLVLSLANPYYRGRFETVFPLRKRDRRDRKRIFGAPRCML